MSTKTKRTKSTVPGSSRLRSSAMLAGKFILVCHPNDDCNDMTRKQARAYVSYLNKYVREHPTNSIIVKARKRGGSLLDISGLVAGRRAARRAALAVC